MKNEIKEKVIKKIVYYLECPLCKRNISGHDKKMTLRNFKRHTTKCKKNFKTKEAKENDRRNKNRITRMAS